MNDGAPTASDIPHGAFVLYRNRAAVVLDSSSSSKQPKIQIQQEDGKTASVRPKDLYLLSAEPAAPGQAASRLAALTQPLSRAELQEGWELLLEMGPTCSLAELAQAVFSAAGAGQLYNAFCLINHTPYFKGRAEAIVVRSADEVAAEQQRKQRKQQEEAQWQQFYAHSQSQSFDAEDRRYIAEIEAIAYKEAQSCRLFAQIKLEASPENAHQWLLQHGLWQERYNPYLRRHQVPAAAPQLQAVLSDSSQQQAWSALLRDFRQAQTNLPAIQDTAQGLRDESLAALEQVLRRFCQTLTPANIPAAEAASSSVPSNNGSQTSQTSQTSQVSQVSQVLQTPQVWQAWATWQRRNLTHLQAWAIDDTWSDDPDDAISLEPAGGAAAGGSSSELWVHIADPSSLLPPGSALAQEAMHRGATAYIPEGSCAMFPRELVGILGLGLLPVSMALSVKLRLRSAGPHSGDEGQDAAWQDGEEATVEVLDLCRSWVRVQRLSYEQVDEILAAGAAHPLLRLQQLCRAHLGLRLGNQALRFDMYHTKIVLGQSIRIDPLPNTPARDLVAEAMLMAGAAIAEFAFAHQLPIPYLCQAAPKRDLPALHTPEGEQDMAAMFQLRKALSPSGVRTQPQRHSALGLPRYTRSTSPLRRYLDLLTHQQLQAFLLQQPSLDGEQLLYCMSQVELQLSRVRSVQRDSERHWQILYLKQECQRGRRYQGVVLSLLASSSSGASGGRNAKKPAGCKALCALPEIGLETVVFCRQSLEPNQQVELVLKSTNLALREAHFQLASP